MKSVLILQLVLLFFVVMALFDFHKKRVSINLILFQTTLLFLSSFLHLNNNLLRDFSAIIGFELASNLFFFISISFCLFLIYMIYKQSKLHSMQIMQIEKEMLVLQYFIEVRNKENYDDANKE